jgi:hypothetical protein
MKLSFEHFMAGIIDYAGLFPPAALDLTTALQNYKNYTKTPHCRMLANFIIPLSKLGLMTDNVPLSVIITPPISRGDKMVLKQSAPMIQAIETPLPKELVPFVNMTAYLEDFQAQVAGKQPTRIFIEAAEPAHSFGTIEVLGKMNAEGRHRFGFKLRCGGVDKGAIPSPEWITAVITACRCHDVPLKFTAGLHHPFRNYSDALGAVQHGFVNVFSAALLAFGCHLNEEETKACLVDDNEGNFVFTDTFLSWNNRSVSTDTIQRLRREKVISFGSCSFEDPLRDLQCLGLL